jgi:hypothetical protein
MRHNPALGIMWQSISGDAKGTHRPQSRRLDLGLAPYGDTGAARSAPLLESNPIGAALRALAESAGSRDFWLLAGACYPI